ncbi:pyridoxamine 5'-phosphate oxidase family protein [Phytomonospora endophytica]|uniref:Pyridoxamine 5'-phosphate oxidase family protein n=1 Tax=Phytomonospora endophytica TaxID=714109 RepID=A0A841FLK7_9ACTN|nr:pyridoxamine 5'-phosphate oxidase family protein [Phytomonospora endophytica]MBB6036744.1 pyridoxamine 5'-phosphate oxidase family protein [Phytomonospora endophytica]GIG68222.1 PPOX class F420-dependent oxidoreductase [Phytomonospora endophytica]
MATLFTDAELAYLGAHRLGRLATVGAGGTPHVVPTLYHFDTANGSFRIGQGPLEGRGQQRLYVRHVAANPRAAFVIDDVVTDPDYAPRGISVKGTAVVHTQGGEAFGPEFGPQWVEVVPDWVSSWGIDTGSYTPAVPRKA